MGRDAGVEHGQYASQGIANMVRNIGLTQRDVERDPPCVQGVEGARAVDAVRVGEAELVPRVAHGSLHVGSGVERLAHRIRNRAAPARRARPRASFASRAARAKARADASVCSTRCEQVCDWTSIPASPQRDDLSPTSSRARRPSGVRSPRSSTTPVARSRSPISRARSSPGRSLMMRWTWRIDFAPRGRIVERELEALRVLDGDAPPRRALQEVRHTVPPEHPPLARRSRWRRRTWRARRAGAGWAGRRRGCPGSRRRT